MRILAPWSFNDGRSWEHIMIINFFLFISVQKLMSGCSCLFCGQYSLPHFCSCVALEIMHFHEIMWLGFGNTWLKVMASYPPMFCVWNDLRMLPMIHLCDDWCSALIHRIVIDAIIAFWSELIFQSLECFRWLVWIIIFVALTVTWIYQDVVWVLSQWQCLLLWE